MRISETLPLFFQAPAFLLFLFVLSGIIASGAIATGSLTVQIFAGLAAGAETAMVIGAVHFLHKLAQPSDGEAAGDVPSSYV